MIRTFRKYLLIFSLALLAGCSADLAGDDAGLPPGHSRVWLSLSAVGQQAQRASWNDVDALDGEMMRSALVVMKNDATGLVERIIPVQMDAAAEHERHDVGYIMTEKGSYTFYSFANIPYTTTTGADGNCATAVINGLTFERGEALPGGLEESVYTAEFNNYDLAAHKEGIPMTNKEQYTIDNSMSITLHLFRMLSRIQFTFSNKTGADMQLRKVVLGEVTANGQSLFFLPPKTGETIVNAFPAKPENVDLTVFASDEGLNIPAGESRQPVVLSAYLNESVSQHVTGQVPFRIELERKDGSATAVDLRYAIMQLSTLPAVSAVPRNAVVAVPVSLTDYMLDLEAFFYAPIGGYPPYSVERDKENFYCRFTGAGDFVLRPFVYRYEDRDAPAKWFDLNDRTKVSSYTVTVADPQDIFSEQPAFSASGELLGTLNGHSGTASVRLTVNLLTGAEGVAQVYNRTIYVIAQ